MINFENAFIISHGEFSTPLITIIVTKDGSSCSFQLIVDPLDDKLGVAFLDNSPQPKLPPIFRRVSNRLLNSMNDPIARVVAESRVMSVRDLSADHSKLNP